MIGPVVVQVFVSYTDRLTIDMSVYRTDGVYPNLPSIKMDEEKHFLSILGGSHSYLVRIHGSVPSVTNFDAEAISKYEIFETKEIVSDYLQWRTYLLSIYMYPHV